MLLIHEWMPLAWLVLIAAVATAVTLLARRQHGRATPGEALPIAHAERLTALDRYRRELLRYRRLLVGAAALAAVALLASITLSSRPAQPLVVQPDLASRDIVLCLDISGSMVAYDEAIIDVFSELSEEFTGERIALVLFNASAVTWFPLTSDYEYIQRQFERVKAAIAKQDDSIYSGTQFGDGSSLIGDGLASCSLRFDNPGEERSRSIIFATDNQLAGRPIFEVREAAVLAAEDGIRVFGINPGYTEGRSYLRELAVEFRSVIEATGGRYYALGDAGAIPGIVDEISAEQARLATGAPLFVEKDAPELAFLLLLLGVGGLIVLAWRVER